MKSIADQCKAAKSVATSLANLSTATKNVALEAGAAALLAHQSDILKANRRDIEAGQKNGLSEALLDRLSLSDGRIQGMSASLLIIKDLKDPIFETIAGWKLANGLKVSKVRVPFGVIGIIYEARPNVTADAIGLCIKSGNCIVLRGSASAYHSNKVISDVLRAAAVDSGVPGDCIQLLEDTTRESVKTLIQMNRHVDLVIPRGGASLIKLVVENATVPAIETGIGNCHVYVDKDADLKMAQNIVLNAKTQRPSVCNACESLLVHEAVASKFIPTFVKAAKDQNVEIRGCDQTRKLVDVKAATEKDWGTEYLDLILSVKIVPSLDEAIEHISKYGTQHTEAIVSENYATIQKFTQSVDAAAVLVNASTRFTDGGEFGFGAEMGISTQKLHARGPMGLPELTTYKYIVEGQGQIRT